MLICVEELLSDGVSDDFGMYTKMGLRLYPNDSDFLQRIGTNCHIYLAYSFNHEKVMLCR